MLEQQWREIDEEVQQREQEAKEAREPEQRTRKGGSGK
jgi:hypothetical protein